MKYFIISILTLLSFSVSFAQEVVQPKIMVVPFTKEGEDVRPLIENNPNIATALTVVKDAFNQRGFTTIDFIGKLKANSVRDGLGEEVDDVKTLIIANSGVDVYVDVRLDFVRTGMGNKIVLNLNGRDAVNGDDMGSKVGESRVFQTNDIVKLSQLAVDSCVEEFLNDMQEKYNEIVENGRKIALCIQPATGNPFTFNDETGSGETMADVIEEWVENHAYKGNCGNPSSQDRMLLFDAVRLPVYDENGKDYKIRKFRAPLNQFLKSLGLNPNITVNGHQITVILQ